MGRAQECLPVGGRDSGEDAALVGLDLGLRGQAGLLAGLGDRQQPGTAVGGVWLAGDEPGLLELVEGGDYSCLVGPDRLGECGLGACSDPGIVALDAQAVSESVRLVAQATAADLARATPCADWTLHGLLRHMVTQHYGFAAASAGNGDLARWRPRPLGDDPVAAYRAAAERVLSAFAAHGVLDREFPLPEFKRGLMYPAAQAISFHFVDYVVHSWDIAKTLGVPVHFDPDLLEAALTVARAVPGGDARLEPGAAFAPELRWSSGSRLDQIVAILGRSPDWQSPSAGFN